MPPPFTHVTVYVQLPGATPMKFTEPMTSLAPIHEPEAVQLAALVLVHETR